MKLTRDEIVRRSRAVHGDKYEYGEYLGYNTKMRIICPIHGEFEQTPHCHINGHGCRKCFDDRRGKIRQEDTETFINKAKKKYGDLYDYSLVDYVNSRTNVKIKCNKCGLIFEQRPAKHLNANGCPQCSRKKVADGQRKGLAKFINDANEIHGGKYDYSQFVYVNSSTPGIIICPIHGPFKQAPNNHTGKQQQGCPECGRIRGNEKTSLTKDEFIKKARRVWGNLYSYDHVNYVNYHTKVFVTCRRHGDFAVTPCNHIQNESGCPKCANIDSKFEKGVSEYLNELGMLLKKHDRRVLPNRLELDLYDPITDIAIECDGIIWHNEKYRDKNFHINKTNLAADRGVRLIHIFEDEWRDKCDIVKSMLANIFGKTKRRIYARECQIKELTPHDKREFINQNHIQGDAQSRVNVGLYYKDELVSVMTFGPLRVNLGSHGSNGNWELVRFCNKLNTSVVGGASKLLKYFQRHYDYSRIVSYCDKRWSTGSIYKTLGFVHDHDSKPNYFYVVGSMRKNRFQYRKSELVKQGYPADKSEHEIMLERKIYRIYDCGTMVFYLTNDKK